ncbi:thiamine phosphate synthase [Aestuariirhabdus litorea]|uniref:Thiamine-phosphate synthase n=1 Tax=Aestuariirhabdus litorea TaxID=2528527 RepID=A0A3P3VNT7_9GAMM|nr:thiamine phosphate synthase [Aestuariirhabdus litorea]RRJ83588.1 thiamine phosphate synthase [Aestuariirhabdus litorea]RWW96809.1 thiamine phosphate synthase [Endozoicomonadaceae bacterium GTF-13]
MIKGLYAITDACLLPPDQLPGAVEQALRGGVRLLQYRDKEPGDARRLEQALHLKRLCDRYSVPLLINDDLALAKACQAAGVHLGQGDLKLQQARAELGPDALIGITCHDSLELAREAQQGGASYVAFGRFFHSHTKPDAPPAPLDLLLRARSQLHLPLVAIGGITVDNAAQVISRGADAIAVIHDLFSSRDIEQRARDLNRIFDRF